MYAPKLAHKPEDCLPTNTLSLPASRWAGTAKPPTHGIAKPFAQFRNPKQPTYPITYQPLTPAITAFGVALGVDLDFDTHAHAMLNS